MSQIAIEEFIDRVQSDVTIFGALPKNLPDQSIRQFVETFAAKWFYENYSEAQSMMYYYVDGAYFKTEEYTKYKYVELPCEIRYIRWAYRLSSSAAMKLGIGVPNMTVSLGATNQPYLSSYVTTIGELGTYKSIIDSMADVLNHFNRYTVKHHFNYMTHRLNLLTDIQDDSGLVLECYVDVPLENLLNDHQFLKYVCGWAKMKTGNLLGTFNFTLPGGVQYNAADMVSQGDKEMKEVEEYIKGMSNSSFFFMVKR